MILDVLVRSRLVASFTGRVTNNAAMIEQLCES